METVSLHAGRTNIIRPLSSPFRLPQFNILIRHFLKLKSNQSSQLKFIFQNLSFISILHGKWRCRAKYMWLSSVNNINETTLRLTPNSFSYWALKNSHNLIVFCNGILIKHYCFILSGQYQAALYWIFVLNQHPLTDLDPKVFQLTFFPLSTRDQLKNRESWFSQRICLN